ncbi:hypothetical protein RCL1_006179 [Eukaryota sp. TZLM3-RCL]
MDFSDSEHYSNSSDYTSSSDDDVPQINLDAINPYYYSTFQEADFVIPAEVQTVKQLRDHLILICRPLNLALSVVKSHEQANSAQLIMRCVFGGEVQENARENVVRNSSTRRQGCPFKLVFRRRKLYNGQFSWSLKTDESILDHNHICEASQVNVIPLQRRKTANDEDLKLAETLLRGGVPADMIIEVLKKRNPEVKLLACDINNIRTGLILSNAEIISTVENMLKFLFYSSHFSCPTFYPPHHLYLASLQELNEKMSTIFGRKLRPIFTTVQNSRTEELFFINYIHLEEFLQEHSIEVLNYVRRQWLPNVEKFVRYYINQEVNFDQRTTSRIESTHWALKRSIRRHRKNLLSTVEILTNFIESQLEKIIILIEIEKKTKYPTRFNEIFIRMFHVKFLVAYCNK